MKSIVITSSFWCVSPEPDALVLSHLDQGFHGPEVCYELQIYPFSWCQNSDINAACPAAPRSGVVRTQKTVKLNFLFENQ
ncbi:hypothetical protein A936_11789 [Enterobacter sp. Ag1]|nr:hypothetical protein A936_11789 [Enterobacter sp. Ag1]